VPRRKKFRHCGGFRGGRVFKPLGTPMADLEVIELQHDELEALRLCDAEGLTQEDAGVSMGVSRGTVQRLVTSGRSKMVNSLLRSAALQIVPTLNISNAPLETEPPCESGGRRHGWGGGRHGGRHRGRM